MDVAKINGVPLHAANELIADEALRQRACAELLRQAAVAQGFLSAWDQPDTNGVQTQAASTAIEALLEQNLDVPEPSEEACRRHHGAHQARYSTGERVQARHILFAVTEGVDVVLLRQRAEAALLEVRSHGDGESDVFGSTARKLSNCPSGVDGGDLGWLEAGDCAPEFARELFGHNEVGVLPRLVHSRFGLHVVEVLARKPGVPQPYESVQGAVGMALRQASFVTALRQYLQLLAGQAHLVGVDLLGSNTPLVQ